MSPVHVYVHFRPYHRRRHHTAAGVARFYYWIFIGWWLWLLIFAAYVLAVIIAVIATLVQMAWRHYHKPPQRRVFTGHGPRDWTPKGDDDTWPIS